MKKVVSATLAGALAVGMVPAMAFAAEGDADLELLAGITDVEAFNQGQVVEAMYDGDPVATDGSLEYVADGTTKYQVVPTKVLPLGETTPVSIVTSGGSANATIAYYKADESQANPTLIAPGFNVKVNPTPVGANTLNAVGTYYAVVTMNNTTDYDGAKAAVKFSVVNKSLADAFAYQSYVVNGQETFSDTVFAYSGDPMGLKFAIGTTEIAAADYGVKYYAGDTTVEVAAGKLTEPGSYRAILTGKNEFLGSSVEIPFQIVPYDLSKDTNIALPNVIVGAAAPALNNVTGIDLKTTNGLKLTFKSADNGEDEFDGSVKGAYTYTLSVADNASAAVKAGVTGSKDITFNVSGKNVAATDFDYNAKDFDDASGKAFAGKTTIDLSDEDGFRFDASKITVVDGTKNFTADEYDVVVTNATTGEAASVDAINTPGVWDVKVVIDSKATAYAYAGASETVQFTTIAGTVDLGARAYVYYGSKLVSDSDLTAANAIIYDGKSIFEELSIVVKSADGSKVLTEGTDYKMTITKTSGTPAVVKDIVDAGDYTITFANGAYVLTGTPTITLKVSPVSTSANADVRLAGGPTLAGAANTYGYTGEPIDVALEYDLNVAPFNTKEEWKALDNGAYKMVIQKKNSAGNYVAVDEVKEAGEYKAIITDNTKELNHVIAKEIEFEVSKDKFFADVPTGAWFHNVVWDAYDLGFMGGYAGTPFFGPNDTLTRAQLVCVLYNIATNGYNIPLDNGTNGILDPSFESFKDVASNKFYSEAIYWAKEAGVVNGYDDGTFKPEQPITRQEAAAMFANFAKVQGEKASAADAAVLAAYPDGAKVSAWAKDSVAWAVDNGIMGNGKTLNPKGDILRAEAAAYAVNYYNAFIA